MFFVSGALTEVTVICLFAFVSHAFSHTPSMRVQVTLRLNRTDDTAKAALREIAEGRPSLTLKL